MDEPNDFDESNESNDFDEIKNELNAYIENKLLIMKITKPNLAFFWRNYLNKYIIHLSKLIGQMDYINSNINLDYDISREQIMMLYTLANMQ